VKDLAKVKPDGGSEQVRAAAAREKFTVVDGRGGAAEASAVKGNLLVRAGKRFLASARRLNKRAGEAEARLILRVFYYAVFGVLSLVRRRPIDEEDGAEVAWSPRESPGTDPTKQY
jgi:hypothetical protein